MMEPLDIVRSVFEKPARFSSQSLKGLTVIVTAGPTREPIDPVRYITNRSSGKMGFALAAAAEEAGAKVILVSGPVSMATPQGVERIDVETAEEMYASVHDVSARRIYSSRVQPYLTTSRKPRLTKNLNGPRRR
ncbi:MAG: hypothetical protein CM1200mP36_04120 [Gammaproteobacteria bacterium]|nr:MAG: hypothetical protein CM1200mP36_04120 [Gammaproteobacteria bacterium]